MQKGGPTSQVADDEQRLFNDLRLMPREENIIQEKTKPMDQLSYGPNRIEHQKKDDSLAGESSGGIFGCEKRAVGGSPKKAEIGIHSVRDPCLLS